MIGSVLANIAEGVYRPSASIKALLERRPDFTDAALMVAASYGFQHTMTLIAFGEEARLGLIGNVLSLGGTMIYTGITGLLMFSIGRVFGGIATRLQCVIAAAWHQLVTTLLWPLLLLGMHEIDFAAAEAEQAQQISPLVLLAMLVFVSQWIWLLARYTATIHGFRNDWGVVGIIVGMMMLFSTLFLMVTGA